jgi:hypothetical protein
VPEGLAELLARENLARSILRVEPCSAGSNNRTYRVETERGALAVKQYFRHPGDARDRLAAEFGFLAYAHQVAAGRVARPLACDHQSGIAVYEFLSGRPLRADEVDRPRVLEAAAFFCDLNRGEGEGRGSGLAQASEACFSIRAHIDLVAARLARLREAVGAGDARGDGIEVDREARALLGRLESVWGELVLGITRAADPGSLDRALDPRQRCVSPSDFGFHNALLASDGSLRFLDFEYAGWDDPAKMVGDFFSQLALPVPDDTFEPFLERVIVPFRDAGELAQRARLLRPVYRIKWCCIALNVFLPVHLARRRFADPALDEAALKRGQLAKAVRLFDSLRIPSDGLR